MELFNKYQTTSYFYNIRQEIIDEIKAFSDDKILNCDFEEWIKYYFEKNKIIPIGLFLDEKSQTLSEAKVEKITNGYRTNQEKMFYDGYKITFKIPFFGNSDLLFLQPSKNYLCKFIVDDITYLNENRNIITFSLSYTKLEMEKLKNGDIVEDEFNKNFKEYIEMIKNINDEIIHFNSTLINCIKENLNARKTKASEFFALAEKLSIPLKISPNAPNIKPIELKKSLIEKPYNTTVGKKENEWTITDKDYTNIKAIINLAGSSMERTGKTFNKLEEEELRDIIISHLNIVYLGTVTGETFTRKGKSDIFIYFENKAAFIAECKIWHGEKILQEAINQLFTYITWRDVKVSIIIFNKENKDFEKLLSTINSFLENNDLCKNKTLANKNEWFCKFIKDKESTQIINVHLIVFDIYI